MAAAAILVALTSLATGLLGATLLRGYLLDRADAQLQDFATVASRVLARPHPPVPRSGQQSGLPTQFLVEVVSSDGRVQVAGDPLSHAPVLRLSAEQLAAEKGPCTARAGNPADSWRVVVKAMPDGQRAVIAFSLDGIFSTVSRLEVADALAGIVAVAVLAGIGLPLVRASLGPLRRIEATAAAIAAGDLSKRIDHPSSRTEVGKLAAALNAMLSRIEAAYQAREDGEARAVSSEDRMRQFVADASHELRTPLTSVRGLAEFALQQGTEAGPADGTGPAGSYPDGPPGLGPAPSGAIRTGPPAGTAPGRRGQRRGRGGQRRPDGAARPENHTRRRRPGHRVRRRRKIAPGHRQSHRQCRAAHPDRLAGHRHRHELIRNRVHHGCGPRSGHDGRAGVPRIRAVLPDRQRSRPHPRRYRARPLDRRGPSRRPRRRHHRGHLARPGCGLPRPAAAGRSSRGHVAQALAG